MHQDRDQGASYQRVEVITGARRRRDWSVAEKARIVAESCKRLSGAVHSAGLKFHGISASISLLGHRLAIRSRVCLAQALGSTPFILQV